MEVNMDWKQNGPNSYVLGNIDSGCGVYYQDKAWWGNIVLYDKIDCIGPFATADEAMHEAEYEYNDRVKKYE